MLDVAGLLVAVVLAWLVVGAVLIGIGLLVFRVDGSAARDGQGYFEAFWLGFAATIGLLQVGHLWWPINGWFVVGLGVLGLSGLLVSARRSGLGQIKQRQMLMAAALAVAAIWLGLMALRPLELYDAGLYHLQAIAWASNFQTIPGLGNLHGRLAFNSGYFLFVASLGQGPLASQGYHVAAGSLVFVFLAQTAVSVQRVITLRQAATADWLLALIALPTLATVGFNGLSTTSTDLPIFLLEVLVACQLLRWQAQRNICHLVNAAVIGAVAITLKLSAAGFVAACAGLVFVILATRRQKSSESHTRPMAAMSLVALLLVGMVVNSVLLSGYPFYPSTVVAAPVDWPVPASQATKDAADIVRVARQPGELQGLVFQGWNWIPSWLGANARDLGPPLAALILGLAVLPVAWTKGNTATRRTCLLMAPPLLGLLIWFFTAPAFRFAGALFWLAAAIPVVALQACGRTRLGNLAVLGLVLASVIPPQTEQLSLMVRAPIATLRRGLLPIPIVTFRVFRTDSGLQVHVPEQGAQAWDGPLPSTPYPDRRLRLRCQSDLACGFVLADG